MINKTDLQNATVASYYWFVYTAFHKLQIKFPNLNIYFHHELNCHLGDNRFSKIENELRYKISDTILNFGTHYNLIVIMRKYNDYFLEEKEYKNKDKVCTLIELTLRFRNKSSDEKSEVSQYVNFLIKQIEALKISNLKFFYKTPISNKDCVNWNIECEKMEVLNGKSIKVSDTMTSNLGEILYLDEPYKKSRFLWVSLVTEYSFKITTPIKKSKFLGIF